MSGWYEVRESDPSASLCRRESGTSRKTSPAGSRDGGIRTLEIGRMKAVCSLCASRLQAQESRLVNVAYEASPTSPSALRSPSEESNLVGNFRRVAPGSARSKGITVFSAGVGPAPQPSEGRVEVRSTRRYRHARSESNRDNQFRRPTPGSARTSVWESPSRIELDSNAFAARVLRQKGRTQTERPPRIELGRASLARTCRTTGPRSHKSEWRESNPLVQSGSLMPDQ